MKKILVVEDGDAERYLLVRRLKKAGYDIAEAETAKESIEKAGEKPDLILLDIRLKGVEGKKDLEGGYRVAEELKKRGIKIPIIFTSVFEDEEDIERGMKLGAVDWFSKPFSTKALVDRIEEILYGAIR